MELNFKNALLCGFLGLCCGLLGIGSGIFPVRTFGIMMTFGTGLGLAVVMLLLPASTAVLRPLVYPVDVADGRRGLLRPLTSLVLRAPLLIVLFSLAIFGTSIFFALRIKVETKFIDYFWPRSEVYQGLDYIDNHLGGTTPIEVFLRSDKPGFFHSAEGLEASRTCTRNASTARTTLKSF